MTGEPLTELAVWIEASESLVRVGKAGIVVLTLGHLGALLATPEGIWRAGPLPIRPVSVVGAGDSFLAAMVWVLASGRAVEEAFRNGVAGGSAAPLTPGTALCHAGDVHALFDRVVVKSASRTAFPKQAHTQV